MNQTIIKVGKIYKVTHERKGKFSLFVEDVDDTWVHGTVVKGQAGALLSYNVVNVGEEIRIRREFCDFELSEKKA